MSNIGSVVFWVVWSLTDNYISQYFVLGPEKTVYRDASSPFNHALIVISTAITDMWVRNEYERLTTDYIYYGAIALFT